MKKKLSKIKIAIIVIILSIIIIDQISKIIVQNIGNITIEQNADETMMYIITNLVIIVIITKFMISQNQFVDSKLKIFLSFIIAGGISNIIDRIFRGYALEWIKVPDLSWLPTLNIAEIFVLIGWILVVGKFAYFTAEELKNKKNNIKLQDKDKKEG